MGWDHQRVDCALRRVCYIIAFAAITASYHYGNSGSLWDYGHCVPYHDEYNGDEMSLHIGFSLDKLIATLAAIGQVIALWKVPKKPEDKK